jgi:hypothetical protein
MAADSMRPHARHQNRRTAVAAEAVERLVEYHHGLRPVQDVLQLFRSYRGPETHLLWEHEPEHTSVFACCLNFFSETRMWDLVRALVEHDPAFPLLRDRHGGTFLDRALTNAGPIHRTKAASPRALLLLAVPGTTRPRSFLPFALHRACDVRGIDAGVVDRLIDLDPEVLMLLDSSGGVPLHRALHRNPAAPFVARMIRMRPESMLVRNSQDRTPLAGVIDKPWDGGDRAAGFEGGIRIFTLDRDRLLRPPIRRGYYSLLLHV